MVQGNPTTNVPEEKKKRVLGNVLFGVGTVGIRPLCPILCAQCAVAVPHALCSVPHVLCSVPHGPGPPCVSPCAPPPCHILFAPFLCAPSWRMGHRAWGTVNGSKIWGKEGRTQGHWQTGWDTRSNRGGGTDDEADIVTAGPSATSTKEIRVLRSTYLKLTRAMAGVGRCQALLWWTHTHTA